MLRDSPERGAVAMRGIVFVAVPLTILLWFGLYELVSHLL